MIDRDKEKEMDFTMYLDYPDIYKEEYMLKGTNTDDIRIDQCMVNNKYYDRNFFSALTPYGISQIEGWMINQILSDSKFSFDELERMIRRNPHLHNVIKTNLINNLNNKRKKYGSR